jgi:acetyl esterase/lipase
MLELDPQIAKIIAADPPATLSAGTLAKMRATGAKLPAQPPGDVERRDHVVAGEPDVVIRVHRPAGAGAALPCVYSMHGGGYVTGSYASDDARLEGWSRAYQCAGVSVEYRLAPETPYPGPFEDCYRGLKWVFDHHEELGVDPGRIGVSGTSAGAGLAAGLAMLARDRGEVPLQFQLLDAPMIDDRQVTPSSRRDDLVIFDRHSSEFGWRSYLGARYGTPHVPAYAAPARATDLSGLPPAYVCVGNVDGFRDEAIDYAMRLNQAGVPAELHVHPGAPHGVKRFAGVPVAQRYTRGINDWIGRQLMDQP